MVESELLRTQVALGRRLWVKVLGMLQQNWAVCVSRDELRRTPESASWLVDAALCASRPVGMCASDYSRSSLAERRASRPFGSWQAAESHD